MVTGRQPPRLRLARRGSPEPESEEEKRKSQPARVITSLKYRFNGEGFIYDRRPHVFVVGADGGTPVQLTDGDFADADPTWSPDGASIVFASARHAERDDDDASDLWRVAAAGGTPHRLTDHRGPGHAPRLLAGRPPLAYLARPGRNAYGRNVRLYTIPRRGRGRLHHRRARPFLRAAARASSLVTGRRIDRRGRRGPGEVGLGAPPCPAPRLPCGSSGASEW